MNRFRWPLAIALIVAGGVLRPSEVAAQPGSDDPSDKPRPQLIPTDVAIRQFEERIERNPQDYLSMTLLGQLYLRQAREEDDFAAIGRAEKTFLTALEIRPDYVTAKVHLASAYESQHRFAEAIELAETILRDHPGASSALATLADSCLEMGRYEQAEKALAQLTELGKFPAILVRQARWLELTGKPDEALTLIQQALEQERAAAGLRDQLAWYEWRAGKLLFEMGRLDEAATHFQAALKLVDAYPQALAGLAAVRAGQGRFDEAIQTYQQAIEASPEPPFLAALGDVYARMGNQEKAADYYEQAEAGMQEEAQDPASASAHRREVALFYADHDRHLPQALELAQADLADRQDIYAYDTLAWALYQNDRFAEAKEAITEALKLGTKDARLLYHAGMIHFELGERNKASEYLRTALEINPAFSPLEAEQARETLRKTMRP